MDHVSKTKSKNRCRWYREAAPYDDHDITGSLPEHFSRFAAVEEETKRAAASAKDEISFIVEREITR